MKWGIGCIGENGVRVVLKEPSADSGMNITANGFYDKCGDNCNKAYCKLYESQKL